jgi:hypothetical protein
VRQARTPEHFGRLSTGAASDGAEPVQKPPLPTSSGVLAAWPQRPRQVIPTGLLYRLAFVARGRIILEVKHALPGGQMARCEATRRNQ